MYILEDSKAILKAISFSDCNIDSYDDIFINLCHLCYNYREKELQLYVILTL